MSRLRAPLGVALCLLLDPSGSAQQSTAATPVVRLQGLHSTNAHGSFKAAASLPDGTLVLLYDQSDGLRIIKTDAYASAILVQAQQGAAGDTGVALTVDSSGNIYVAGTSSSGQLGGTSGAAFPAPVDSSLNSFVAKFDSNLNLTFLTFLGSSRTEVTALAATPDALFVTGATYGGTVPTTTGALQPTPPNTSTGSGNGFIERFTTDGTSLTYATYLSGVDGGTVPSSIAATASDAVYIAGETSASSFPTLNALQPAIFGPVSGFLSQLAPDGASLQFSTFIAGSGISSLALDPTNNTVLMTGDVALSQFPVAAVATPLAATPYQSLLRLSPDGQSLIDSVLLLPSTQSFVTPGPSRSAWVTGSLSAPLSSNTAGHNSGDSFVLHVTSSDQIDRLLRTGGSATNNAEYARLTTALAPASLSSDGQTLTVPGTVFAQTDPSYRATQAFDLSLNATSSGFLSSSVQDLLPITCTVGQSCTGSAALLTQLALSTSQASLSLSAGDLPNITVHNLSATSATALNVTATGFSNSADCASALAPFAQCTLTLSGPGPGAVSVSSANAAEVTASIPAITSSPQPLPFSTTEIDFGIVTAVGATVTRTVTVTNLSDALQTFTSAPDNVSASAPYALSEAASTCPGTASAHTLAPHASCTVEIGLTASSSPQNDGVVRADWKLGTRDIEITGFTQVASLAVSASEVDFGPQPSGSGARLPRYLYLSNSSPGFIAHSPLTLPDTSPFGLLDGCPSTLAPASVCQITLTYNGANASAFDSTTLTLDQGLTVLVTGQTVASSVPFGVTSLSPLLISPSSVTFTDSVAVTQLSTETQTVQVTNNGPVAVPLSIALTGDFTLQSGCPAMIASQQTCSLALTFTPSQPGVREGSLIIAAAPGEEPLTLTVTGTATPLLPVDNGSINLGQMVVGEPVTTWLQVQGSFPQVSASVTGTGFSVAILADDGSGHGTLPPSAFSSAGNASCAGCWLAVSFLPQISGAAEGTLQIASLSGGQPYRLQLKATAIAAQGLVVTPADLQFGAVPQGTSSLPLTAVLTNLLSSGTATAINQVSVSGDFQVLPGSGPPACTATLEPTASCSVQVVFTPTAEGQRTGTLTLITSAGTSSEDLIGIGIQPSGLAPDGPAGSSLTALPSQVDFGSQPVSVLSTARQITLTNASSQIQGLSFAASRNFPLAQLPACTMLAPQDSCTFTVVFDPEEGGPLTGTVIVTASPQDGSPSSQRVLYLRGYGAAAENLTVSGGTQPESPITFGNLPSGSTSTQTVTLTNNGMVPHTVRRLTTTTPFQVASTTCAQTLLPGDTCNVVVAYTAGSQHSGTATQTPHTDTGTILLEDDTAASPSTLYLSGIALSSTSPGSQASSLPTYALSQSALTFPNTQTGSSTPAQVVTLSNNGAVPVTFNNLLAPADFPATTTCTVLQPGAACSISVLYRPSQSSTIASGATIQLLSNATNALDFISVLGSAFPSVFQLSPASLSFGSVTVGKRAQRTATLTNITDLPSILGTIKVSGDYAVDASACPATLAAGQSCSLTLTFTPSASGLRSGSASVADPSTGSLQTIALTGTGLAGQLALQPQALSFGVTPVGTSVAQNVVLSNTGPTSLGGIAPSLLGANASEFSLTTTCQSALAPGASCVVQVTFTPSAVGAGSATLSVASTDPSAPALIPLSGAGSQPPGFTLSINGSNTGAATIASGATAAFPLTLTSQGGYTGTVTLTCTARAPAPNATCTLASTQLTLTDKPASSSASIQTASGVRSSLMFPFGLYLLLLVKPSRRTTTQGRSWLLTVACTLVATACLNGCGSGPGNSGSPYTPPGAYQYHVTAASASSPALSSTVTLSVTVH